MVVDCITYNGEREVLEIRLNILNQYVDKFIVVEAKTTFSGNKKPLYFSLHERYFEKFWHKIDYYIIDEDYSLEEIELAESSPNTVGARHWKNEFLQKESLKKALKDLSNTDTVYIGDVDEIWEPYEPTHPTKLKHLVYAYWLNNRSNEEFWGTLVSKWGDIKDLCLNHIRSEKNIRSFEEYGWHFTSMGGFKEVQRKLNDSYTTESYNTYEVQQLLSERLKNKQDYLGRPFIFNKDETDWPKYLQENRWKYPKLLL